MRITYRRLLAEHRQIGQMADAILAEAATAAPDAGAMARQLDKLARLVTEHIRIESEVAELCADIPMPRQWHEVWSDGASAFSRLCTDWQRFLSVWSEEAIASDMAAFRMAADTMLGRLSERVAKETAALHVSALQFGVIELPEAGTTSFLTVSAPH